VKESDDGAKIKLPIHSHPYSNVWSNLKANSSEYWLGDGHGSRVFVQVATHSILGARALPLCEAMPIKNDCLERQWPQNEQSSYHSPAKVFFSAEESVFAVHALSKT
jgi:hypothetical protein